MKILQINVASGVGSTGRIMEQIGQKLIDLNSESILAFGSGNSITNSIKLNIGSRFEKIKHILITRLFDSHGHGSINSTKLLIRQIKALDPDIIHLHNLHGYYINVEILFNYLKEAKKPVIWTLHDCWSYTGHCCHYTRVNCQKWKTQCNNCPLITYYPSSLFIDNSKFNYNQKKELFNSIQDLTIVPVSDWLTNEVSQSFLKNLDIETIKNGIDTNTFKYIDPQSLVEKHKLQGKKVILGVASKWSELKGMQDFLMLSKMLNKDFVIILIGLSKTQINSLPNEIIGIDRLDNLVDLARYYSLADVFFNPSIAESFGLVTVESMACGTPVIGYKSTATPELISPGTGYVVEKGDLSTVVEKIKVITTLGKHSYSSQCISAVLNNYTKEIQTEKYIELYKKKILSKRDNS